MYEVLPAEGDRQDPIKLNDLPKVVTDAIVAAEDERFFQHRGVDASALVRATWQNIRAREVVSGASTIEEQLIKNAYFPQAPRTVVQKIREAAAATAWSLTHTKEETLEMYLNVVPYSGGIRGIGAAAHAYFHTGAANLNTPQAAMLAGVIAAPSAHDPFLHTREARERQSFVLDRMVELGSLSATDREALKEVTIPVFVSAHPIHAPHAVFRILSDLEQTIPDIRQGGYVIHTTLDAALQSKIESTVTRRVEGLRDQHVTNAAAVAMSPQNGEVLAYVGSVDYFDEAASGKVDMAAAKRQPGSALKPFLYLLAFLRGMPPSAPLADIPVRYVSADGQPYYPRNYDYRFHGVVSARDALGSSLNVPAVNLLNQIGLQDFFGFLKAFGITFPQPPDHYGLGIVLGGGEVTLFDATNAYAALARGGRFTNASLVRKVTRTGGETIFQASTPHFTSVISDESRLALGTRLLTDVLSDKTARVRAFGEGNLLDTGNRIAVKTGTTRDFRDNWAFGYTPDFALGVWVGNANNRPMEGVSGITGAVPMWADVMRERYRGTSVVWSDPYEGLVTRDVCVPSGQLATSLCSTRRKELFIPGTEPTEPDTWFVDCSGGRIGFEPPPEYRVGIGNAGCDANTSSLTLILTPLNGDVFTRDALIDSRAQGIPFTSTRPSEERQIWRLDGQAIETFINPYLWTPTPGEHVLGLDGVTSTIHFTVE